jgi:hypothetical protein
VGLRCNTGRNGGDGNSSACACRAAGAGTAAAPRRDGIVGRLGYAQRLLKPALRETLRKSADALRIMLRMADVGSRLGQMERSP